MKTGSQRVKAWSWRGASALALIAGSLAASDQAAQAKEILIAQSLPTLNNPWYVAFEQGSRDMAKALGVKLSLVTNPATAPFDPSSQINSIENLIARHPAAMEIDPTSTDAINSAIAEARAQKIPVVTDGIHVSGQVDAAVVADNKQGGQLAGTYVAERLKSGGEVAMLDGTPGRDIITQRQQGFKAGLAGNPSAKIVAEQNANLDQSQGQTVAENILEAHPKLAAMWGANDSMALGALEALKARGLAGKIILGGFDGTPDAFNDIKAGTITFTIDQVPYEMGATAIAYELATGKKPDASVVLGTALVTKDNVDDYLGNAAAKRKATLDAVLKKYGLTAK